MPCGEGSGPRSEGPGPHSLSLSLEQVAQPFYASVSPPQLKAGGSSKYKLLGQKKKNTTHAKMPTIVPNTVISQ